MYSGKSVAFACKTDSKPVLDPLTCSCVIQVSYLKYLGLSFLSCEIKKKYRLKYNAYTVPGDWGLIQCRLICSIM